MCSIQKGPEALRQYGIQSLRRGDGLQPVQRGLSAQEWKWFRVCLNSSSKNYRKFG
jgi:hypothetical protein